MFGWHFTFLNWKALLSYIRQRLMHCRKKVIFHFSPKKRERSTQHQRDHPKIKERLLHGKKETFMSESMTTLWLFSNKYFLLSTQWFVIQTLHVPFLCVFSIVLYRSGSSLFHLTSISPLNVLFIILVRLCIMGWDLSCCWGWCVYCWMSFKRCRFFR